MEGYRAGFAERDKPVCTLTSGYVRALMHALTGEAPHVREVECMITGAKACRLEVDPKRSSALHEAPKTTPAARPKPEVSSIRSATVNEHAIIEAVTGMPVFGAENGLIPAFNVYLANMPADFYNLLAIRFVEEMQKHGQGDVAAKQLVYVAETCGLNTFRGILDSPEWEALIAPMVKQPSDVLFGIIAVSNALGWGHWRVTKHESRDAVTLVSYDGYEADGMLEYRGGSASPSCHMLSGVATGIMELVYGSGSLKERFGQYAGREHACRASKSHVCEFHVESCEE